jgi:putative CocE/NonD family hydrolase
VLTVRLSSSQANADLHVYLEDVAPDGRALLVTEGQLRLNYVRTRSIQDMVTVPRRVIPVRPDLPWHGFTRADYVSSPLAGNRARDYELDLHPTAWVFRAGHRIRVSLAGADTPLFELHPELDPAVPLHWTLGLGSRSRLTLPVIPSH